MSRLVVGVAVWGVIQFSTPATTGQTAFFSLEGRFATEVDLQDFLFDLSSAVGGSEVLRFETFGHSGGTTATGKEIPGGGFDPNLELFDGANESRGISDNGVISGPSSNPPNRDAVLSWPGVASDLGGAHTPLHPDPLPAASDYGLQLSSVVSSGGWAVDLVGPADRMTLTGLSNGGSSTVRSLAFGTDVLDSAVAKARVSSGRTLTVTDDLAVARNGDALLQIDTGGVVFSSDGVVGDSPTFSARGTVEVRDPGSAWDIVDEFLVGVAGSGALDIVNGGSVSARFIEIGSSDIGTATVDVEAIMASDLLVVGGFSFGDGTLTISGGGAVTTHMDATVGADGGGKVFVRDGGRWDIAGELTIASNTAAGGTFADVQLASGGQITSAATVMGAEEESDGRITLQDGDVTWTNHGLMELGINGAAAVDVLNGAALNSSGDVLMATGSFLSNAVVRVMGVDPMDENPAGATMNVDGNVHVGGDGFFAGGNAALLIGDSARVNVGDPESILGGLIRVYETSEVELAAGGTLSADTIQLDPGASFNAVVGSTTRANQLTGFGPNPMFGGSVEIGLATGPSTGGYTVNAGESLTVGQDLVVGAATSALISISAGGQANIGGNMVIGRDGKLRLNGGEISAQFVELLGGDLRGNGNLLLADSLKNGGIVSPGDSAGRIAIDRGSYQQTDAGTLRLEIGGTDATAYDRLEVVSGSFIAGGTLHISVVDGFDPQFMNVFDVLAFVDFAGVFQTIDLPVLGPNLAWDLSRLPMRGQLHVASALLGDGNKDGIVSGADLIAVQQNFGKVLPPDDPFAGPLQGDANYDGHVSGSDLTTATQNFGKSLSLANVPVPEPASSIPVVLACVAAAVRSRRNSG